MKADLTHTAIFVRLESADMGGGDLSWDNPSQQKGEMYKNSTQLLPSFARLWKQGEHVALLREGVAFTDASFNDGNGSGSGGVGGDRTLEKKEPSAVLHGPRHCLGFAEASFTVPLQSSQL